MQQLVLITLFISMTAEGAANIPGMPGIVKFLPEILGAVLTLCVIFEGVRRGFDMPAKYWMVLCPMAFIIVCGVIVNDVGTGPIVSGLRYYLRWVPLFLMPAVCRFDEKQIRQQLWLLLGLGLLQVPIAIYQRYVIYQAERFSGDDVRGTINDSGVLSIVLICMVLVLTGCVMRKRINKVPYFLLFFTLLLPTTINETKATVILLPLGLITTVMLAAPPQQRLKILFGSMALMAAFLAIMVPIYDKLNEFNPYKNERGILTFFTDQDRMQKYLEAKDPVALGTNKDVRRGDAIAIPFEYLTRDPIHLAFGLGMGNVTKSTGMGDQFTGNYYSLFERFVITDFSQFLLELGVFGVSLIFVLYWIIFRDAWVVAKLDTGLTGAIAAGWVGIVVIMGA
ncbi:MAG: hypothetical protein JO042_02845, partial [Sinobacteraceae bacterium]|nr:hypothetical protein [Nevskiaceae bacterium]